MAPSRASSVMVMVDTGMRNDFMGHVIVYFLFSKKYKVHRELWIGGEGGRGGNTQKKNGGRAVIGRHASVGVMGHHRDTSIIRFRYSQDRMA